MTSSEVQEQLEVLEAIDLCAFGYRYTGKSHDQVDVFTRWMIEFDNPFSRFKLRIRLMVPLEQVGGSIGTQHAVSLDAFLESSRPEQYQMDLWRYCHEHGQPLAEYISPQAGQTMASFVAAFISAFVEAANSYLRDFLLGKAWENQKDYRDMI